MEQQEYEIMMFNGDDIIDGSHMITSDRQIIKLSHEYAVSKGYKFSSKKVK